MLDGQALEQLVADGFLRREGGRIRTAPRWQAATARAAARLKQEAAPWRDLRLSILIRGAPSRILLTEMGQYNIQGGRE
jgi:hypothetical protein